MSDESIPQNLGDHLYRKLAGLHANAALNLRARPRRSVGFEGCDHGWRPHVAGASL